MNWIKENKFTASILAAALLVSGVFFYVGYSMRSKAKDTRKSANKMVEKVNRLKKMQPYPSAENNQLVHTKVSDFTEEALRLQASLVAFKPAERPPLSETDFAMRVSDYRDKLIQYYKEKEVSLYDEGKGVTFGLEAYASRTAIEAARGLLDYEREAFEWLFTVIADADPDSLDNVYRPLMAEERPGELNNRRSKSKKDDSVYRALPIEITFTGTEESLKYVLKELSDSKEYFYITRSVRISNLKNESPNLSDGEFKEIKSSSVSGGEAVFFGLGRNESNSKILKQVTGTEKIKVHLKLDLILFKPAEKVIFPGASALKQRAKQQNKANAEITEEKTAEKEINQ